MAAEVPVSDVLCEAMEYLSKLGANLRSRSENLKDKRIRKDKLRNAHAVHKAAKKVLLICELSKKSLENVETGVRKVLSTIDASQAPSDIGGKTINTRNQQSKQKFYYFEYDSHKLRISKKIPLKHFMSVKVLARDMPISMQSKYPVFYNCKLKQQRKRELANIDTDDKSENSLRRKSSSSLSDTNQDVEISCENNEHLAGNNDEGEVKMCTKNRDSQHNSTDHNKTESDWRKSPIDVITTTIENRFDVIEQSKKISLDSIENKSDSGSPVKNTNCKEKVSDDNEFLSKCSSPEAKKERRNSIKESEDEGDMSKTECNGKTSKNGKKQEKICTHKGTKLTRIRILNDSSDSDDQSQNNKSCKITEKENQSSDQNECNLITQDIGSEPKSKKNKIGNIDEDSQSKDDSEHETNIKSTEDDQKQEDDDSKPLIRCVNITKLLKPDILDNTQIINNKFPINRITEPNKTRKPKDKSIMQMKKNEEFWEQKRKEVKLFKPKKLTVPIQRLPQLSTKFMLTHNLKKVIQGCNTICELTKENEKVMENLENSIDKVKNALLNDSESENESAVTATVKKTLLNESDKELNSKKNDKCDLSKQDKVTNPAAIKNALLNDSDSDKNDKQYEKDKDMGFDSDTNDSLKEIEKGVAEKIKNALLNDSDSENNHDKSNNEHIGIAIENKNDDKGDEPNNKDNDDSLSQNNAEDNSNNIQTNNQESPQDAEKIKSSLLNDSSNSESESAVINKKTKKLKKHKRRHSIQTKKNSLNYSSSSENQEEQSHESTDKYTKKRKRNRTRSYVSNSSSNEERKKKRKKNSREVASPEKSNDSHDHEENDSNIEQGDDTIAKESNSSVSKMVRSKAKPSGSSGQNSDNQDASDKDIDGLTNLNSLHKTHRRRDSTSTNNTESRSSGKKNSSSGKSKAEPIIGEDLLRDMSSSDVSEDDHAVEEDLPPVKLTGLNGDSISHLAKDDLLGDTDSSTSHDKEHSEDRQAVEESEEENVKLKRRKANAISSDSEGGTSRRKQTDDVRLSDFEDSEEESSEPGKRSKRKKNLDSDASGSSSNDESKKKRRRIKQVKDSDDGSGSDTENEGRNKHGRKNIRKVMGKNQLEEATKKAAREEKERIARIAERQKLYNNLDFDESGKPDEVVLEKVVLDFDPETKEPLIEVDRGLVKKLKPHQANGIKFMWDACFESVKRIKKDKGSGCILAHCMGLGKTLQVISLTHTLLIHGTLTGVNRVLVVCPLSTVLNWVNEFRMWLKHADSEFEVDVYELSRYKQNSERAFQLQQWFEGGGVCVLGYEMFRNLSADNTKKFKKKMLRSFQESLVDPGPDLVVCDEGHLLKNEKTSLSQSMNRVKTRRRIVLTGTPLQNNLKEYYCMVQFVKPNLLGKYNEYLNRFVNPITNGQYTDSTEHDIRVMKRRSHVLHKMLDGAVQRRDYGVLAPFLPPKHEYVLFITLTDVQVKLYQFYLDNYSRRPLPGKSSGFLFPDFQSLQRIWTHPLVLKYNSERYEIMQQKKREREEEDSEGSLVDFIDDDSTPEESSTEESTDDSSELSDDSRKKSKKKKSAKKSKGKDTKVGTRRGTRANPVEVDEDPSVAEVVEVRNENPTEWWIKLVEEEELEDMRNSHKLVLLFDILRQCEAIGDKLLVFSQSLYSLDLIEHFLGKVDEATQEGRIDEKLGGHVGSWSPGVDYFRLDGSTSCENRSIWCKNFNREDNPRARLFLISTRAGGLGINLVAANRVVIFDVSWNPSHDVQSIFRVYRFGQKKPCYIYRFLAMGTMEEKIYERQVTKQAISKRVIDEQQIDRHYAENDLAELYKFEARPDEPRPLPTLPKDRLFAEMLKEHEAQIYKYHEHDSLLENKEEETLSEEERKAAWEDFENEKNKPPPAPFPTAWPMHNGMVPGLMAQQQLAFTAMAAMLRKEMPNINDNQIRDMLPLIYNSNPGLSAALSGLLSESNWPIIHHASPVRLMQKMSEIYKYAQPGMMNPGMMNPVMNPGSGTGASGMGGTSGLQYEPPWQRQHQQQQQMRLQQLMQQQNQMGAKFYAGGLGSRDPVAMALQQQRAREIMMGGAGRPRGRPPHAPRPPAQPAPPHDVVNLDSD